MSPPLSLQGSPDTSVKCPEQDCHEMAFDRKGSSCPAAAAGWGQRRGQSWGSVRHRALLRHRAWPCSGTGPCSDTGPHAAFLKTLHLLFLQDVSPFTPDGFISPWVAALCLLFWNTSVMISWKAAELKMIFSVSWLRFVLTLSCQARTTQAIQS